TNIMSHLVGVRVYQRYCWQYAGMRHIAIHGHQFDGFQVNNVRLSRLGTSLYLKLQKLDFKNKPIVRLIDRLNTRWLRMSPKVSAGALQHARQHNAQRIFCGHTHQAVHVEADGIHYYNSGGWVDSRLTYLTVDEEGVRIHEFNEHEYNEHEHTEHESHERADHRDSGEERGEVDSAFADFADEPGLPEDVVYESVGS
ncbi:MAG: UDP-2,3-diacylglucosamine diphosphatase, partial [Candidatus Sulfotelmatobacter sp.]